MEVYHLHLNNKQWKPHEHSLSRFNKANKEPSIKSKSLLNVADLNTTNINNKPLKYFTKMTDIFNTATQSDKNMNKFFPELEGFKQEAKSANVIKSPKDLFFSQR